MIVWFLLGGLLPPASGQAGKLEVRYLDIGQADAILVTCPDGTHHLLIDAADQRYPGSSADFRKAMTDTFPAGSRSLTTVVASHPHQDHIGSMEWLLKNFTVGTYVDNGQKFDSATFGRLDTLRKKLIQQKKIRYVNGKQNSGEAITFCPDVTLRLLSPWAADSSLSDPNDRSVAVRLDYKETSFLFVGDIEDHAEHTMLDKVPQAERDLLDVDVLKVGHHGSDTSSTAEFLNAITPEIVVISCGEKEVGTNDGYKHPRLSTVRHLNDMLKAKPLNTTNGKIDAYDKPNEQWRKESRRQGLWVTTADGEVVIHSDGQTLEVSVKP